MSSMKAIETAMIVHGIPEESAGAFITGISLEMECGDLTLDQAIEKIVPHFETELCGDCLIPASWNETKERYICSQCGA